MEPEDSELPPISMASPELGKLLRMDWESRIWAVRVGGPVPVHFWVGRKKQAMGRERPDGTRFVDEAASAAFGTDWQGRLQDQGYLEASVVAPPLTPIEIGLYVAQGHPRLLIFLPGDRIQSAPQRNEWICDERALRRALTTEIVDCWSAAIGEAARRFEVSARLGPGDVTGVAARSIARMLAERLRRLVDAAKGEKDIIRLRDLCFTARARLGLPWIEPIVPGGDPGEGGAGVLAVLPRNPPFKPRPSLKAARRVPRRPDPETGPGRIVG